MKFRSPTEEPVRVALLSGHTAIVGPEWRPLDQMFHTDALQQGCQCDQNRFQAGRANIKAGPDAINQTEGHGTEYRKALTAMLEREVGGDFNGDGLPNIKTVTELCGFRAKKEDVYRVYREMLAEAETGEGDEGSGEGEGE